MLIRFSILLSKYFHSKIIWSKAFDKRVDSISYRAFLWAAAFFFIMASRLSADISVDDPDEPEEELLDDELPKPVRPDPEE